MKLLRRGEKVKTGEERRKQKGKFCKRLEEEKKISKVEQEMAECFIP